MAATMIHLLLAHRLESQADGLYYRGHFAPDAIDLRAGINYEEKGKWHLRNAPNREAALKELYARIDKNDPFQRGYFSHLFFDWCWDADVIGQFQKASPQDWFAQYRQENSDAGVWVYKFMPWMGEVVQRFQQARQDFLLPMEEPTKEEITHFCDFMFSQEWKEKYIEKADDELRNKIITPAFLEKYIEEAADKHERLILCT